MTLTDRDLLRRRVFGYQVRVLRRRRDWSQSQLAYMAGLRPDTLSKIEMGSRSPTLETAHRIAEAVGVSLPLLLIDVEGAVADATADAARAGAA